MDCIFCRIIAGQIPSTKVAEDDRTVTIMDINPLNDGHLLVLTRAHAANIFEVEPEDLAAVIRTTQRAARAIRSTLNPDGINLLQANGGAAFQSVLHFHLHVIPRWTGDGKGLDWRLVKGDPARIAEIAAKIRGALTGS